MMEIEMKSPHENIIRTHSSSNNIFIATPCTTDSHNDTSCDVICYHEAWVH